MLKIFPTVLVALALVACGGGGVPAAGPTAAGMPASAVVARSQPPGPSVANLVAGPVSIANTTTEGDQTLRAVDATADGGYVVAWYAGGHALFTQAYDVAGARSGTETPVPVDIPDQLAEAARQAIGRSSVAVLRDGTLVVAYNLFRSVDLPGGAVSTSTGAFFQRFDASGNRIQPETVIAVHAFEGPKGHVVDPPSALALSDGGFVVASRLTQYSAEFGSIATLSLLWFDSQGQAVGSPVVVGDFPALVYRLAADTQGGGFTLSVAGTDHFFQRQFTAFHYDAGHAFLQVVPPRSSDVLLLPVSSGFVLFEGGAAGATAQALDRQGLPVGDPVPIASLPVAALELVDGSYVAVQALGEGFVARRFTADGTTLGKAMAIDSGGALPRVTALADPGFAAAWTTTSASGDTDVATQGFLQAFSARKRACIQGARDAGLQALERKAFVDACMA